jgi:hypothetical protein
MDQIFESLHSAMPFLYILTALAIVAKIVLVMSNKGFDVLAILGSFFRIYTKSQRISTTNKKRRSYMVYNNYINIYIYIFILLFIVLLLIFQSNMFN